MFFVDFMDILNKYLKMISVYIFMYIYVEKLDSKCVL